MHLSPTFHDPCYFDVKIPQLLYFQASSSHDELNLNMPFMKMKFKNLIHMDASNSDALSYYSKDPIFTCNAPQTTAVNLC